MDYLIVGLGNPDKKYENTRHNAGFQVVDFLAEKSGVSYFTHSSWAEALTVEVVIGGQKALLVKPESLMNNSGQPISDLLDYFDIDLANLLVVHDDIDLPLGELRVSFASGAGGHNGVRSVINAAGSSEFTRLRVGIRPEQEKEGVQTNDFQHMDTRDFVLRRFNEKELKNMEEEILPTAYEATEVWVKNGHQAAMNEINEPTQ